MVLMGNQKCLVFFIFTDSLVDSGNNNNLENKGKVNYLPYGMDFPDGPTGRFTNGRTMADVLGMFLTFIYIFFHFTSSMKLK